MDEKRLGSVVGVLIFGLSGLLAAGAWAVYATVWWTLPLAVSVCFLLEAGKLFAWRRGGWRRLVAVAASAITLLGIASALWGAVSSWETTRKGAALQAFYATAQYQSMLRDQQALETEREAILVRLEQTPADWATVFRRLNDEESRVSQAITTISQKMASKETAWTESEDRGGESIFQLLARVIGIPVSTVEFVFLMSVAGLLEVFAYALAGRGADGVTRSAVTPIGFPGRANQVSVKPGSEPNSKPAPGGTQPVQAPPSADDYLRVATDHSKKPFLMGRVIVAEKLGISEAMARGFLEHLLAKGAIERAGKYFRASS